MYRRGIRPGGLVVGRASIERSGPSAGRRDVVDAAVAPGVAPPEPSDGEPAARHRAVLTQGGDRVAAAGGVVPAGGRRVGGDEPLIEPDRQDQQPGHRARSPWVQRAAHGVRSRGLAPGPARSTPARRAAVRSPSVRSRSNRLEVDPAAAGSARTTRSVPPGSRPNRSRTRGRSRRVMRWRTTELPTLPDTTKPTRDRTGKSGRVNR